MTDIKVKKLMLVNDDIKIENVECLYVNQCFYKKIY